VRGSGRGRPREIIATQGNGSVLTARRLESTTGSDETPRGGLPDSANGGCSSSRRQQAVQRSGDLPHARQIVGKVGTAGDSRACQPATTMC